MPKIRTTRAIYVEIVMGSLRAWSPRDKSTFYAADIKGAQTYRTWHAAEQAAADVVANCDCVATPVMR